MLNLNRSVYFITFLLLLFTIAGCEKRIVTPIELVQVPPKYAQKIVVKNDSTDEMFILPAPGLIGEPVVLDPGESTVIDFSIERHAVVDDSGNPLAHTWTAQIADHPHLGMRNVDGVLLIKTPDGEIWEYLISLGGCWFENNPPTDTHELTIGKEEPGLGIPVLVLCE